MTLRGLATPSPAGKNVKDCLLSECGCVRGGGGGDSRAHKAQRPLGVYFPLHLRLGVIPGNSQTTFFLFCSLFVSPNTLAALNSPAVCTDNSAPSWITQLMQVDFCTESRNECHFVFAKWSSPSKQILYIFTEKNLTNIPVIFLRSSSSGSLKAPISLLMPPASISAVLLSIFS